MHHGRDDLAAGDPAAPSPARPVPPPPAPPPPRNDAEAGTRADDNEPGLLDDVADKLGFREFLRRHRSLEIVYRALIAVLGVAIMITGFALIPLPGPGWLIVFAGLALLATEFSWAERLLHYGRDKFHAWTGWVLRQNLAVRGLIALLGLAVVAGVFALYVKVQGVPGWLPLIG